MRTVVRYDMATITLYDGDDLMMELDGAGNPVREYTYYPGVDQPHSVRIAGQTYYYVTDQPGSVTGLFNAANGVVNEYRYTPWGETEAGTVATVEQPLGYMAREWDDVAGMYQVRARWYDPRQGRFVSEDPIGLSGGLNPYVYANNSPTNLTDPYGLCPEQPRTTGESAHKEHEKTLECIYQLEGITAYARRGANWLFSIGIGDGFSRMFGRRGSPAAPGVLGDSGEPGLPGGPQGVRESRRANARRSNVCLARNTEAHLRFGLFASVTAGPLAIDLDALSFRLGKESRFTSGIEVNLAGTFTGLGYARQSVLRKGSDWTGYSNSLAAKTGLGAGVIVGGEASVDWKGYVNCLGEEASHGR